MTTILGYFVRDSCAFGPCEEPPADGLATCKYHEHCTSSLYGSRLNETEVAG